MQRPRWRSQISSDRGIICGSDANQEWLLPWWWSRLRDYCEAPVAFCDFGMSEEAKQWCRERGELLVVPPFDHLVAPKENFSPEFIQEWEKHYTETVWELRQVWFKKPIALLQTPFRRSLWLDLDCEVVGSLELLFEMCHRENQIGIVREFTKAHYPRFHPDAHYNSGVIVFEQGVPLIEQWAWEAVERTDQFGGDDVLLSHLINKGRVPVIEIPAIYNWRISQGINLDAVIWHWMRDGGKTFIQKYGGLKPTLDQFRKRCTALGDLE
jgi:hypothetical protein